MTKAELTKIIIEKDPSRKPSPLMRMRIEDLQRIADQLMDRWGGEEVEPVTEVVQEYEEIEISSCLPTEEKVAEIVEFVPPAVEEEPVQDEVTPLHGEAKRILDNLTGIKIPKKVDKQEFHRVAVEAITHILTQADITEAEEEAGRVVQELLENKSRYYPISENEAVLLETLPLMDEFQGVESRVEARQTHE